MIHVFHTSTGWKVCQEYPEEPTPACTKSVIDTMSCALATCQCDIDREHYTKAVALSIANAVDVREEDLHHLWNSNWFFNGQPHGHDYKENQVYSLPELEMEIKERCSHRCRLVQIRRAAISVNDACLNGDKLTCVFYSKLAHVFRKKEEKAGRPEDFPWPAKEEPKIEESQEELWQMIQDEMVEDFRWPNDLLELLKSKFHLTRVKAELKGEKK